MWRLRHHLIALPVCVLPGLAMNASMAVAETVGPVAAVELLVKARVADARCNVLAATDRDELSDYVARGEIAAAERFGVETAKSAVAAGRRMAEAAPCDVATRAEIVETLAAARAAVVSAELRSAMTEDTPPPRKTGAGNSRMEASEPSRKPPAVTPATSRQAGNGAVGGYADEAMAYYVERRCGHLTQAEARRFWQKIVDRHKLALSRYGAGAVRAALKQAEAAANAKRCSTQTAMLVKGSFAAIRR